MLSVHFNKLVGYLSCTLFVLALIAPSNAQFEKRVQVAAHNNGRNPHRAGVAAKKPEPDINMWGQARDTLAFDAEFGEVTSFPNVHFSAVQFLNRTPKQMLASSWTPHDMDTRQDPVKSFYQACYENTEAGKRFQMAGAGLIDLDSRVFLINMYGTFGNAYGHFTPWVWKKDGIMAVSCQYMSVKHADLPGVGQQMNIDKFNVSLESSTEMIQNLKKNGHDVHQAAGPSFTRKDLEIQLRKNGLKKSTDVTQ